jgi:hypothetical protein
MKGPAESGQIRSVGRRKIAKKIAKNKRRHANTLRPRSSMLLKGVINCRIALKKLRYTTEFFESLFKALPLRSIDWNFRATSRTCRMVSALLTTSQSISKWRLDQWGTTRSRPPLLLPESCLAANRAKLSHS